MRKKFLNVVLVFLTGTAIAQSSNSRIIDCTQLLSWIAAGIPQQRIIRLVEERGIGFQLDLRTVRSLRTAGANSAFIRNLHGLRRDSVRGDCPAELVQTDQFIHQHEYDQAEQILRRMLAADPQNPDLHFALGYVRQQQDDDDQAFDEYSEAKQLLPGFPEIHNGLAFNFYRSNNGENAIAEARTALSIDPQNAEGYRYLGLGLLAQDNYSAAVHAFKESLVRDCNNAQTYNDLARAQSARGDLAGAADSYRQALRLDVLLIETRKDLTDVLRKLSQQTVAAK
jgi:cytochrome c-type biogenesis protein CcmH/NrfG